MNTPAPSFLALLQAHAHQHGDRLLHLLPDRDITYRRLWSRTERASARLQGEWGVQAGDVVAYVGSGHPDAIVLYFALLRLGASLLPLEALSADETRSAFTRYCARLAVHDDSAATDGLPSQRLEMLLDDWCHAEPVLVPDDPMREALWLPSDGGAYQPVSLGQLSAALPDAPRAAWVQDRIFTADILGQLVLPSLRDARRLYFAATEPQQRTGS
jgi:acyl-CoA synthetase (AMP-forming)/AMP-acid ligase II